MLSLGPRNGLELARLREAGCQSVSGLDLFSTDPAIHVGDMHAMPFLAKSFGLIWASHALEHAREPERVFKEIARVLRPGGYLFAAWPTGFKLNWHDFQDYGNPGDLGRGLALPRGNLLACRHTENEGSAEWAALYRVGP